MRSEHMEQVLRLANSPAVRMATRFANSPAVMLAERFNVPARHRLIQMETQLEEVVEAKPQSTLGERLPRREVIHGRQPG